MRTATTAASALPGDVLQYKCAVDTTMIAPGRCAEGLQRRRVGPQPSLVVGEAGDPWEREADRVAERIERMDSDGQPGVASEPPQSFGKFGSRVKREAPPIVHEVVGSPGRPLDAGTLRHMEARFGHDFSEVRVHTGARPAASAAAVHARAYTVGHDIVFSQGCYQPSTREGLSLLAHELTHVVQQGGGSATSGTFGSAARLGYGPLQRDSESEEEEGGSSCPPAERLDEIEATFRAMIVDAREDDHNVAADNLQHFLNGSGTTRTLPATWLRSFSEITDAEVTNQERFENQLEEEGEGMRPGDRRTLEDHWDRSLTGSRFEELYYASGTSTIRSTGHFQLRRTEDVVNVGGSVEHHWFDPYDWHAGLVTYIWGHGFVSDSDAQLLQNCRGASSFQMESDWSQRLSGSIEIGWLWNSTRFSWSGP
jgi:hypothetical protein